MKQDYDFIVVGGGTAGCVIAARLSEDPAVQVLLVEAGAREPVQAVPSAWPTLLGTTADWGDLTVVQRATGTRIYSPRGRGLGGSSSINGLAFVRGHSSSYDAWVGQGAEGWGFDDLLPYFKRSENIERRDASLRGRGGPMKVAPVTERNPLVEACVDAAVELGYERAADIGSGLETGVGFFDNSIANGARLSAADAQVYRLRVHRDRCVGVDYANGNTVTSVDCSREVVLTASAFGSPQLLLLSGIGPGDHLRELGIDVVLDLPGVGANLHDHVQSSITYRARRPVPLIACNPTAEALTLIRSEPTPSIPDLQLLFAATPYHAPELTGPEMGAGYSIVFSAMNPHSRGTLRLASADPTMPPLVDTNYYGDERDITTMAKGLEITRSVGESKALSDWRDAEALSGPSVADAANIRNYLFKNLLAYFHYTGTCRIGTDDMAVVDPELRLRGISGLRVADASVMPSVPAGNTNATVYAIGERAADILKNRYLPRRLGSLRSVESKAGPARNPLTRLGSI